MKIEYIAAPDTLQEEKEASYSLATSADLDPLLERIGNAHFVLLGEATHGTHEYYTWRAAITRRLITEKGFNIIAVEGDWPDCYKINRYIKGYDLQSKNPAGLLHTFTRWPGWMWANWEIVSLLTWLKDYNDHAELGAKIGFYGLDVYSLWQSMDEMFLYLQKHDPKAASLARDALHCFESYNRNEYEYARAWGSRLGSCRKAVTKLLKEVRTKSPTYDQDPEAELNISQNAHIMVNAEEYYRNMMGLTNNSWNLRDTHMIETLNRIIDFYGNKAKAIIWEHNTHIGDARFTDMKEAEMINVGQLVREQRGDADTVLVGFGSYEGSVIAGENWGSPMQIMKMPPATKESIEALLHQESTSNRLLLFDPANKKERFSRQMKHRAIGVIYDPERDAYSNYVPTILNKRYDAFIYLDKTMALHPLHLYTDMQMVPETYPFAF